MTVGSRCRSPRPELLIEGFELAVRLHLGDHESRADAISAARAIATSCKVIVVRDSAAADRIAATASSTSRPGLAMWHARAAIERAFAAGIQNTSTTSASPASNPTRIAAPSTSAMTEIAAAPEWAR